MTDSNGRPAGPGTIRIAVDLLGGDDSPAVVVDGALLASSADPVLHLHLVGPPEVADEVIAACPPAERGRFSVQPVRARVGMADAPSRGVRQDTTVRAGVAAVAEGRAHALVSAGMSGAVVTAAALGLGRSAGVRKPALAAILPAQAGPVVLLDVGASPELSTALLLQHAALGTSYARRVLGIQAPRLGLLSIGAEPGKGDRARRAADVKGIEGAFELAGGVAPHQAVPRAAALLGVGGTVVVCHGAASAADIASGIALAARLYHNDLLEVSR